MKFYITGERIDQTWVNVKKSNAVVKKFASKTNGTQPTCVQQLKPKMPINDIVEKFAMAIVHRIGENCGVSVPVRQSTNDVNIDETIATIKQLLGTIGR